MSRKRHAELCRFGPPGKWHLRTLAHDFAGNEMVPPHAHDWHQLVYASQGVMTIRTPDGSWVVPAHRGVWVPAYIEHSVRISGAVRMRTLYLWPGISKSLPTSCRVLYIAPLLKELIVHAVAIGNMNNRVRTHARIIQVILDQLRGIDSPSLHLPEPADERVLRVAKLLHDDPGDRRPLSDLSRRSGGSKRTIERLFRMETGMSFGRWRQQLRLIESLRLLAAGRQVTSVALEVGYDSASAFVSAFRKTLGTTPGRYFRAPSD